MATNAFDEVFTEEKPKNAFDEVFSSESAPAKNAFDDVFAEEVAPVTTANMRQEDEQRLQPATYDRRLEPNYRDIASKYLGTGNSAVRLGGGPQNGMYDAVKGDLNEVNKPESSINRALQVGEGDIDKALSHLEKPKAQMGVLEAFGVPFAGSGKQSVNPQDAKAAARLREFKAELDKAGVPSAERPRIIADAAKANAWTEKDEDTIRHLSTGEIAINPGRLFGEKEKLIKEINASDASAEDKTEAVQRLDAMRAASAEKLAGDLHTGDIRLPGAQEFRGFMREKEAKGVTDTSQILDEWIAKQKDRGLGWKMIDGLVSGVSKGALGVEKTVVGGLAGAAALTGLPGAETLGGAQQILSGASESMSQAEKARGSNGITNDIADTVTQMAPMFAGGLYAEGLSGLSQTAVRGMSVYGWAAAQGYESKLDDAVSIAREKKGSELTPQEVTQVLGDGKTQAAAFLNGAQTALLSKILGGGTERVALGQAAESMTVKDFIMGGGAKALRDGVLKQEIKSMAKTVLADASDEAVEEFTNQVLDDAISTVALGKDMKLGDLMEGSLKAGALGGLVGGVIPQIKRTPAEEAAHSLATDAAPEAPQSAVAALETGTVLGADGNPVSTEASALPAPAGFENSLPSSPLAGDLGAGAATAPTGSLKVTAPTEEPSHIQGQIEDATSDTVSPERKALAVEYLRLSGMNPDGTPLTNDNEQPAENPQSQVPLPAVPGNELATDPASESGGTAETPTPDAGTDGSEQPVVGPGVGEAVEPSREEYAALLLKNRKDELASAKKELSEQVKEYGQRGEKHPSSKQMGGLNPAAQKIQGLRGRIAELTRLTEEGMPVAEKPTMAPLSGVNPKTTREGLVYNAKFQGRSAQIGKDRSGWYVVTPELDVVTEGHKTPAQALKAWSEQSQPTQPTNEPNPQGQESETAPPEAAQPAPAEAGASGGVTPGDGGTAAGEAETNQLTEEQYNDEIKQQLDGKWGSLTPAGKALNLAKFAAKRVSELYADRNTEGRGTVPDGPGRGRGGRVSPQREVSLRMGGEEISTTFDTSPNAASEVKIDPKTGEVALTIGGLNATALSHAKGSELAAKVRMARVVDEEVIHAAHVLALKSRVGVVEDYDAAVDTEASKVFDDIVSSAKTPEERAHIEGVLKTSVATYRQINPDNVGSFSEVFNNLDAGQKANVVSELVRQVVQLRQSGQVTETSFQSVMKTLTKWLQDYLGVLKSVAAKPESLGPRFAQEVRDVEAMLATLNTGTETGTPEAPESPETDAPVGGTGDTNPDTEPELPNFEAALEDDSVTGLYHAQTDADRARLGLPPRFTQPRTTDQEAWDRATAAEDAHRAAGKPGTAGTDLLTNLLNNEPRVLTKDEHALLLHEKLVREQAVEKTQERLNTLATDTSDGVRKDAQAAVSKAQDAFDLLITYADAAGSRAGLSLQARKMLIHTDFTLAAVVNRLKAAKNLNSDKPTTWTDADQKAAVEIAQKLQQAQERVAALEAGNDEQTALIEQLTRDVEQAQTKLENRMRSSRARKLVTEKLNPLVEAAKARMAARKHTVIPSEGDGVNFAGPTPEVLADLKDIAIIASGWIANKALTLQEFSTRLTAEFGDWVAEHAQNLFRKSRSLYIETAESVTAGREAQTPESVIEGIDPAEPLDKADVWKLARAHVIAGERGRNVLDKVFGDLSVVFPAITREEVAEAFTGYGTVVYPSDKEVPKELRRIRSLEREYLKQLDIAAGQMPKRTGRQVEGVKGPEWAEVRAEQQKTADALRELENQMREAGIPLPSDEKKLANAEEIAQTRLKNEIAELQLAIDTNTPRTPSTRTPLKRSEEVQKLKAQLKLKQQEYAKAGLDAANREKRILGSLKKRRLELERRIATKDFSKSEVKTPVNTEAKRKADYEFAKVRAKYDEMRHQHLLKNASAAATVGHYVVGSSNLLKMMVLGTDVGVIMRQLGTTFQAITRDLGMLAPTKEGAKKRADGSYLKRVVSEGIKAFGSEEYEHSAYERLMERKNAGWDKTAGLVLNAPFDVRKNSTEDIPPADILNKVPWWVWPAFAGLKVSMLGASFPVSATILALGAVTKPLTKALDRAQRTMTNQSRALFFDEAMAAIHDGHPTVAEAKALAKAVMVGTGRGTGTQKIEAAIPMMNQVFLATRYYISRIQAASLYPLWNKDARTSSAARKEITKMYGRSVAGRAVMYGLAAIAFGKALTGDDDDPEEGLIVDPRNPNFGRLKLANGVSIDYMSSLNQYVSLAARMGTKTKVDPKTGRKIALGSGFSNNALDEATKFLKTKLNLQLGFAASLYSGAFYGGKPATVANTLDEMSTAIIINDTFNVFDTMMKEHGDVKGAARAAVYLGMMFGGAGASVYSSEAEKEANAMAKREAEMERKQREAELNE